MTCRIVSILHTLGHCTTLPAGRAGRRGGIVGLLVLLMMALAARATAQPGATPLQSDTPQTVLMQAETPLWFVYAGSAGEVISLAARSTDPESVVDTVLEIRLNSRRVAYSDNHNTDLSGLAPTDAVIAALTLPTSAAYFIRLDSYGSIGVGEVELHLTRIDPFGVQIEERADGTHHIAGILPRSQRYVYLFEAAAGDLVTITATDTSGTLDLILWLYDETGELLVMNDDHAARDVSLNLLDAHIADFRIPADGRYHLVLTDFLGVAGSFEIVMIRSIEP